MKIRFSTFDIVCTIAELQKYVGMRVNNVYDIDHKTYLIRLQKPEEKCTILLESGTRLHGTHFEWPKNTAPSGFSMKMRKHLSNKRLESLRQLGTDRIVDMQFGSGEAAYHVILELYDKGNIILTDFEYTILNVLRPHTEGDRFKFVVREKYPENRARKSDLIERSALVELLEKTASGNSAHNQLKKLLVSNLEYGPALIEHVLLGQGFTNNLKIGKNFSIDNDVDRLLKALEEADEIFNSITNEPKGFIIQKKEERLVNKENQEFYYVNQEFHPFLFRQHVNLSHKDFDSFNLAVDEFFSSVESQKIEVKALQAEREALKKLDNVKKDHVQRLQALEKTQESDRQKAEMIMRNQELVDEAILAIQTALASQISWDDLHKLVEESANSSDENIAKHIKGLKLATNHITLYLTDPYIESDDGDSDDDNSSALPPMNVDIDLALTAFANSRRYYDQKRHAAHKQQKTLESQTKAFKSAEKKTKQTLKDVQTITSIIKARKVYWFEKFFWFITSENYLVIAGRDQQQNELIVKRYMKPKDIYVHADIHGASSVIIKNPTGGTVPPKSLNEAGTMSICYSVAWDAKVVTNAYWVWGEQVSKTAPSGEYLATGSFMVRGRKNFLPQSHLVLGLSFLFKLEDGSVERHKDERKIVQNEDDIITGNYEGSRREKEEEEDEEIPLPDVNSDGNHSQDEEGEGVKFPDTKIKIEHAGDDKVNIITESVVDEHNSSDDEKIVFLGDDKPVMVRNTQRVRFNSVTSVMSEAKNVNSETKAQNSGGDNNKSQLKRGQKSKLKKIKEKYKDQDEEERQLRMEILQSAGVQKQPKKTKKNKQNNQSKTKPAPQQRQTTPRIPPTIINKQSEISGEADVGEDDHEEPIVQAEVDVIDSLTGIPVIEDELLFAVPVVAPYNTLANYKYKVKLTPGTGRRGKVARTALMMFLKDRTITPREKDLLKAVKDELLARNIPGKVKLSAPKLQTLRK